MLSYYWSNVELVGVVVWFWGRHSYHCRTVLVQIDGKLKWRITASSIHEHMPRYLQENWHLMAQRWLQWWVHFVGHKVRAVSVLAHGRNTHYYWNESEFWWAQIFPYWCVTFLHQLTPQLCCAPPSFHGHHAKMRIMLRSVALHPQLMHADIRNIANWYRALFSIIWNHICHKQCDKFWIPGWQMVQLKSLHRYRLCLGAEQATAISWFMISPVHLRMYGSLTHDPPFCHNW